MRRSHGLPAVFLCLLLTNSCNNDPDAAGLAVGAACERDAQCSGAQASCLVHGLYPLTELAASESDVARDIAELGVPLPGGYCSNAPPCATDEDCGRGGTCFFPLRNTDLASFTSMVSLLELPPAESEVLMGFLEFGQCLRSCDGPSDCPREGYVCAVPLEAFISLVPRAELGTFCIGQSPCASEPCQNGSCASARNETEEFSCTCSEGWEGTLCELNHDDCSPNPCQNNGTCQDAVAAFTCSCPNGFTGTLCETAVSGCLSAPCVHGSCTDTGPGTYDCDCAAGWAGDNCDANIDDCAAEPCAHGTCVDAVNGFSCDCATAPGWQGTLCDADIPDCAAEPCAHGTCVEGAAGTGTFTCTCEPGWEGTLCDENIDDCDPDPCENGGVCSDAVNGYSCACPGGFTGTDCEIPVGSCLDGPCLHGTCTDTGPGTYECECEPGWIGINCDLDIDECITALCAHETCVDEVNGYHCDCSLAPGWQGTLCDEDVPDCAANPCVHGTCTEGAPGTGLFTCACTSGWTGTLCDEDFADCAAAPCQHGGTCVEGAPGTGEYTCQCTAAWTGPHCETAVTTHCLLTYDLVVGNGDDGAGYTGTNIRIRDTTLSLGDGTWAVGPGLLILRVPSDGGQHPAPGLAEVLYYELALEFQTSTAGITVTTDVDASSPELGDTTNDVAQATGMLALGTAPSVTWQSCTYPTGYNNNTSSFTPDTVGSGTGCLAPYNSEGNVNCLDESWLASCASGGLADGDNPQDETWEQALQPLTLGSDLATLSMPFMLVPDRNPARTYVSWGGTLASTVCQ